MLKTLRGQFLLIGLAILCLSIGMAALALRSIDGLSDRIQTLAVAEAGLGDLEAVRGISRTVAKKIYDHFHGGK